MGIKERKEREKAERRNLILETASKIMKTEGLHNLSIRKIAAKIEYSPAIIYHYFQDKDAIVNHLMQRGYQKIVQGLASVQTTTEEPSKKLEKLTRKYIEIALATPDEYSTVLLSNSPDVLKHTASLFKGAASKKPALGILCQCLIELYGDKEVDDNLVELTAQWISTATFGLIIRLIMEQELLSAEQRERLIEHHIKCLINVIFMGNA